LQRSALAADAGPSEAPTTAAVGRTSRRRTLAQTATRLRGGVWAPIDLVLAAGAMLAAQHLSPFYLEAGLEPQVPRAALVFALVFVVSGFAAGLYDWTVWKGRRLIMVRAALTTLLAAAATLGFHYVVFYAPLGRRVMASTVLLSAPLVALPRLLLWEFLKRMPRRLLFVGADPLQRHTRALLAADRNHTYEVVDAAPGLPEDAEALAEACLRLEIDEVLLPAAPDDMQRVLAAALACVPLGCRVRSVADFHEDVLRAVPVRFVNPQWLLARGWDSSDHLAEALKRASDVLLALLLLAISLPLLALVAVAQRVAGDGGPLLYSQMRVGRYGRPFRIHKLRTMHVLAEVDGPRWAQPDDPRRTRLGALLRRTRIDELPQLVNVLRGDMSFVGPRPERPEFVAELERVLPFYGWRHLVRPGLTGWAQINYPYGADVRDAEHKLEYDLYYLRHVSLFTDLTIVARTLSAAMRGAR
jgi:exopolysaccharide biosynthesis polyprenyl glycosylphosphotransferase